MLFEQRHRSDRTPNVIKEPAECKRLLKFESEELDRWRHPIFPEFNRALIAGHPLDQAYKRGESFVQDSSKEIYKDWDEYKVILETTIEGKPLRSTDTLARHFYSPWQIYVLDEANRKHICRVNVLMRCLYLDVANYVIVSIREELKRNWIQNFTNPADFSTRDQALAKLHNADAFDTFKSDVAAAIDKDDIEHRFDDILNTMTNGSEQLEFGKGKWLEMTQGKKVFSQVINSNCFRVVDLEGNLLQGKDKINQVAKNLLRKEIEKQPDDFRKLKTLVEDRLSS